MYTSIDTTKQTLAMTAKKRARQLSPGLPRNTKKMSTAVPAALGLLGVVAVVGFAAVGMGGVGGSSGDGPAAQAAAAAGGGVCSWEPVSYGVDTVKISEWHTEVVEVDEHLDQASVERCSESDQRSNSVGSRCDYGCARDPLSDCGSTGYTRYGNMTYSF